MGTSQATKVANHNRIVEAASELLRERGTDAVGVAEVMSAASLTHGGFYAHFANRDSLIDEAMRRSFAAALASFEDALASHPEGGLVGFVDVYLSALHRDHRELGCAVAALAGDVARSSQVRRDLFGAEFAAYVERMIELTGGTLDQQQAAGMLSALAGAVSVARAVGDPALAQAVLDGTRAMILSGHRT